jgi:hypothetical protein
MNGRVLEGCGVSKNELLEWDYVVRTKGNHENRLAGYK